MTNISDLSSKKSYKIIILSHKFMPFIGGIEIMSLFLAEVLVKNGYVVKVVTWTPEIDNKKHPFEIIRNPDLKAIFKYLKWADLVLENNPILRMSWPLLFIKKPLIVVLHTWINRTDNRVGWQDRLKKVWLKRANKIVVVSKALKEKYNINALVVENPYRAQKFKILNNVERTKDFVFLGRLVSDKGVELAVRLIYELTKIGHVMNLTVIGDGPERENLKQLIETLNLNEMITLTGVMTGTDLVHTLNEHRFILVPSIWEEPFGLVALEGMACGCIPIVSNGGGLPDAVGEAGIVFERGELNSLVSCVKNFINESELELTLRNAAPKHLKKHHPDFIGEKYLNLISQTMNITK